MLENTIVQSGAPAPAFGSPSSSNVADSGAMIQGSGTGTQVSTPGYPDAAGNAFNVAYGSTVPSTPSS